MASNVVAGSIGNILKDYNNVFALIGAASVSFLVLKIFASFWNGFKAYFLSPVLALGADLKSFGSWAVVTGSTDGIGKAYAFELARRGLNIVLISRSADKLKGVAEEIEAKYNVSTKCLTVDFADGLQIYDMIGDQLSGLDIGVLVNNVGASYVFPHYFLEVSTNQDLLKIININCNAVTFMTRIVLPKMLERKKGAIINISSLSGASPTPLLTVYSASKAYIDFFSRGLQAEYGSKGIIVQSVLPGFVTTKLSKIRQTNLITPNPQSFAKSALSTVGIESRTTGFWTHAIQKLATADLFPEWLFQRLTISVLAKARAQGLKKLQNQKTE